MKRINLLIIGALLIGAAAQASADTVSSKFVNCSKGESIKEALQQARNDKQLDIVFKGTCSEFLLIDRDAVTLRGADSSAVLVGLIDVIGVKGVVIRDFTIQGGPNHPRTGDLGGVNVLDGSVRIDNMLIQDVPNRGIQLINSEGIISNVTVLRSRPGNLVFRSSHILFGGNIVADGGFFGISLVNSTATAKGVNFTFKNCQYGIIVQINSGLEHITGKMTLTDNNIGIAVLAQGVFALGSFVEVHGNRQVGILLDELSSMTPLVGAPGGGPALTVTGSPIGISVERDSTFELFRQSTVTNNGIGLQVDASTLVAAAAKIYDNTEKDVSLGFGTKATFNGEENVIESPVACDEHVITRGPIHCGATLETTQALLAPAVTSQLHEEKETGNPR
jgi:hypothetical protein